MAIPANVAQLAQALRGHRAASQQVSGLEEDMQRARAMQTASMPQINANTGYVSPLAVLAGMVGSSRGRQQQRELRPRLEQARQQALEGADASALYNAQQKVEQQAYTREQAKLKKALEAQKRAEDVAWREGQRSTEDRINPFNGKVERVEVGPKGVLMQNNQPVRQQELWLKAPTKTKAISSSYGSKEADKRGQQSYALMKQADRAIGLGKKLNEEDVAQLSSAQDRFKQIIMSSLTPESLRALTKSEFSGYSPEVRNFMENLASMSAEERHALFGATLTGGEKMSSEDFQAYVQGLSFEELMRRVASSFERAATDIQSMDEFYGNAKLPGLMGNIKNVQMGDSSTPDYWRREPAAGAVDDMDDAQLDALLEELMQVPK